MTNWRFITLLTLIPFLGISQRALDPFQIYGPRQDPIIKSFKSAIRNKKTSKLKAINEPIGKDIKKIGKLNNLYVLHLEKNNIDSIPTSFSNLNNLQYFLSSGNPIKSLPNSFARLRSLNILKLYHTAMDSLPKGFKGLGNLTKFELQLSTSNSFKIDNDFAHMYSLKELTFFKIKLSQFPKQLDKCRQLKSVLMVDCSLSSIDSSFFNSQSVEEVILDLNKIEEIPWAFNMMPKLKVLRLQNNNIKHLPEFIGDIRTLETLDLRGNPIPKREIDIIKILLPKCRVLF